MSKELQEQIADLTDVVTSLKDEVVALKTGGAETNTKLTQALTELDANKEAVKARDRVSAILADAEKMKGIENWAETVRKQLGGCKTVAEVDSSFEKVQSTLIDMGGKAQPAGSSIIISENRDPKKFFGKTGLPKSIPEAYNRILDRFTDSGVWDGKNRVENPRCIAKTLVDNFLKNIMAEGDAAAAAKIPDSDLMRNTRHNPLRFFLDAVGDDDTVGADVARTNSFLLPLYVISIEDLINLINQVAVTLPMDRDQGLVGFMKEYYGDGAGAWTEINKTNFDRTKGEKAEEATPQLMKVKIATNTISLQTALKFMAEWTVEAGLKMSAYWGLNIENPHLQAVKKEVMRAVSHKILYDMLTGTSCTNNDNCVSAGGNLVYPTAAPVGYSQAEWERCGITKTINRAAGLIDDVDADFVICDKTYGYLFSEPYFTKENRYSTNFGFTRAGTFNAQYGLFLTNASFMSKKIIVGYRGSAFTDAAQAFLPYVLFYLGGLVEQKNGDKSRTVQSFFAIQKIYGKRLVIVTIDGDPV